MVLLALLCCSIMAAVSEYRWELVSVVDDVQH